MLNSHCHVSSWKMTLAKVTERSYARMDGGSIFAKNVPGQKMKIHCIGAEQSPDQPSEWGCVYSNQLKLHRKRNVSSWLGMMKHGGLTWIGLLSSNVHGLMSKL